MVEIRLDISLNQDRLKKKALHLKSLHSRLLCFDVWRDKTTHMHTEQVTTVTFAHVRCGLNISCFKHEIQDLMLAC